MHRESEMGNERHRELRLLLQQAGLKASLVRLKVMEVLQGAGAMRSRELHERLLRANEQISMLSVRQVPGRLGACGLVLRDERGCYRLIEREAVVIRDAG
ncbi:Fur family transcriptional regulator [Pseudomonas sp. CAU 1711]|uniref:Fur family transcriptional regulator n=1 Tax=Pseudomonas sp. CAU 1711 TaxID=3140356 RepID=UPI003260543C